jgi:Ca-activated chloride channel family protein
MNKELFTYSIKRFIFIWLVYELVFFALLFVLFYFFDFFKETAKSDQRLILEHPENLFLFFIIPVLAFLQIRSLERRNRMLANHVQSKFYQVLFKPVSTNKAFLQFVFLRNIVVFLILALANPLLGKMKQNTKADNLELVICLDISNSMNAKDIENTSRLEVAKRGLSQLVNQLKGERIGMCVFAGTAFVQLPLTNDYHAAKLFIQEIETDMISAQGTNVSSALTKADQMFTNLKTSKGILLVTDGEDHEGLNDSIIDVLKQKKIDVSVFGIGTEKGAPLLIDVKKPGLGYKKSGQGEVIVSCLNTAFIKELANKLNGSASVTTSAFPNMSEVLTEINQMKQGNSRNLEIEINESWYQIPVVLAVINLILFFSMSFGLKKQTW